MDKTILRELKLINKSIKKMHHNLMLLIYHFESEKFPDSEESEKIQEEKLKKFEKALNIKTFQHQFSDYLG